MTYNEWEKIFIKTLNPLDEKERNRLAEYYREIYEEKLAEGKSEEIILEEFGSPVSTAYRILAENSEENLDSKKSEKQPKTIFTVRDKSYKYIGLVLLSLLLIIPIAGVMVGVIVAFGAVSISGIVVSIAGVLGICLLPFIGVDSIVAGLGICIATIGVGALIFASFYCLTKYLVTISCKCLKALYSRSKL